MMNPDLLENRHLFGEHASRKLCLRGWGSLDAGAFEEAAFMFDERFATRPTVCRMTSQVYLDLLVSVGSGASPIHLECAAQLCGVFLQIWTEKPPSDWQFEFETNPEWVESK